MSHQIIKHFSRKHLRTTDFEILVLNLKISRLTRIRTFNDSNFRCKLYGFSYNKWIQEVKPEGQEGKNTKTDEGRHWRKWKQIQDGGRDTKQLCWSLGQSISQTYVTSFICKHTHTHREHSFNITQLCVWSGWGNS